jgi:hypothetical protein
VVRGLVRGLAIVVIVVGVAYLGLWGVWQVWGPGWLADEAAGAVAAQPVTPVPQEQYQAGYAAGCEVGKSDAAYGNHAGRSAWMIDGDGRLGGPTPEAYDDGWQAGYRDGRNDIWSVNPEGCLP